jgi:hypothetical protein
MPITQFPSNTKTRTIITIEYLDDKEPEEFEGDFFGVSVDMENMLLIGSEETPSHLINAKVIRKISLSYKEVV